MFAEGLSSPVVAAVRSQCWNWRYYWHFSTHWTAVIYNMSTTFDHVAGMNQKILIHVPLLTGDSALTLMLRCSFDQHSRPMHCIWLTSVRLHIFRPYLCDVMSRVCRKLGFQIFRFLPYLMFLVTFLSTYVSGFYTYEILCGRLYVVALFSSNLTKARIEMSNAHSRHDCAVESIRSLVVNV